MAWLRKNNRITKVQFIPNYRVDTWWDIGFNDINAIWFVQTIGLQIHVINYYENFNEGLGHYAEILRDMQDDLDYKYGKHYVPHDMDNHDYSIGRKRSDYAKDLGLITKTVPKLSIESGIEAVRKLLPYCVFDLEKCDTGLKHLEAYRKEWDEKRGTYRNHPYHDVSSNGADAFRTGSVIHPFTKTNFKRKGSILIAIPTGAPPAKGWTA
jgi:hypothetical protein